MAVKRYTRCECDECAKQGPIALESEDAVALAVMHDGFAQIEVVPGEHSELCATCYNDRVGIQQADGKRKGRG